MSYYGTIYDDNHLAHHGIKGMHWGIRKSRNDYRTSNGKNNIGGKRKALTSKQKMRRAVLIGAGAAGATLGTIGLASTIAGRAKKRKGYGSYQEIGGPTQQALPYKNYDSYNPYKQKTRSRFQKSGTAQYPALIR